LNKQQVGSGANNQIDFQVLGVGAWGPGFNNWLELSGALNGQALNLERPKGPKPEIIPANERRRAPLPVRLAVESSWQACQQAGLDPKDLASVFVSGLGDTQLTDYMCRTLASNNKALSPTKFHNSVHNAAAGYWTISTGCMQAANSVGGFDKSVSLTLMEALIQSKIENRAVLLTFYDAPSSDVLMGLMHNDVAFAASIIVAPVAPLDLPIFQSELIASQSQWPSFVSDSELEHCYEVNPAARILPLLKMLTESTHDNFLMPLSEQTSFKIFRRVDKSS